MFDTRIYSEYTGKINFLNEEIEYTITSSDFNEQTSMLYVLVPGIFGDRCDSRSFFVKLSRNLASKNMECVRFDFIGGGYNKGDYSINSFDIFIKTLDVLLSTIKKRLGKENIRYCLISMSEAAKVSIKISNMRKDVSCIIFCNGILVKEDMINVIERPVIRNKRLVYNSMYGVWTNFEFVEKYPLYYIRRDEFSKDIQYYGIYGNKDSLTQNSRDFLLDMNIPVIEIDDGDHLFLKKKTFDLALESLTKLAERVYLSEEKKTSNYIKYIVNNEIVNLVLTKNESEHLVVFIPGLFQTGTGAGFLFKDIADYLGNSYDYLFIEFPGQGESYGSIFHSLKEYVDLVKKIIEDIENEGKYLKQIIIGNGLGNHILADINTNEIVQNKIFLAPENTSILKLLPESKLKDVYIDTYFIYEKNEYEADMEIRKIGNVRNRSSGEIIPIQLLKEIDKHNIKFTESDIIIQSVDCLFISTINREQLLEELAKKILKSR